VYDGQVLATDMSKHLYVVCVYDGQVLATDMSKHLDHLAHLKTMVETHRLSGGSATLLLCDVSERLQVKSEQIVFAVKVKVKTNETRG